MQICASTNFDGISASNTARGVVTPCNALFLHRVTMSAAISADAAATSLMGLMNAASKRAEAALVSTGKAHDQAAQEKRNCDIEVTQEDESVKEGAIAADVRCDTLTLCCVMLWGS